MATVPTFDHERQYWNEDIIRVAGVDEAGMGALAGPVVAAVVVFDQATLPPDKLAIRDSKTLSAAQRQQAVWWIMNTATAWAIASANVQEIDTINIRKASHLAIRRAADALETAPDLLLIDGNPAQPHPHIPSVNIIDGDADVFSIAAASILAKVHRDWIMHELEKQFPAYGFAGHKGYGTAAHLAALREQGISMHHRTSYAPVAALKQTA